MSKFNFAQESSETFRRWGSLIKYYAHFTINRRGMFVSMHYMTYKNAQILILPNIPKLAVDMLDVLPNLTRSNP